MGNVNSVVVSGRLTRDPELRATAGGSPVLGMALAVNDRRRNPQSGQWEDVPNYVDATVFGTRAEALARILAKGALVCVAGRLRWSSWERDGQRRSRLEVVADEVELMAPRGDGQRQDRAPRADRAAPSYTQAELEDPATWDQGALYSDEIPF